MPRDTKDLTEIEDKLVVRLAGEVDLEHCLDVRALLLDAVARGKDLLVDLSEVTYLDSSGIASLIETLQAAAGNGTALKLFSANPQIWRVLELARLDKVFTILPDLDAAMASET